MSIFDFFNPFCSIDKHHENIRKSLYGKDNINGASWASEHKPTRRKEKEEDVSWGGLFLWVLGLLAIGIVTFVVIFGGAWVLLHIPW